MSSNFEQRKEELAQKVQELIKANEAKSDVSKMETITEVNSEAEVVPSTSESALEMSEIEKEARRLGWKSKEERLAEGKNNHHFVEADEYVRRQPLFERIDRQSKELRELKSMNQQIAQHLSSLRQEAYDQALKDLESRRIQAINEGEGQKALAIERQQKDMEVKRENDVLIKQAQIQTQPEKHPEVSAFESRNAHWYNTNTSENRRMVEAAGLIDKQLAEQAAEQGRVLDPKEHLRLVEENIRRVFPHRFETKQEAPKKEASHVPTTPMVGVSSTSKELSKSGSLVSRLTPEQRKIGEHFMRSNPKYTLEAYAKDLERMGRLK